MACNLSKSPTLDADRQGIIGATFQITAVSPTSNAALSAASYGKTTLTASPYEFTIVEGITNLATIVEGDKLNALIQIQEVCTGGNQTLRQFEMADPDHTASSLWIKGIKAAGQ